MRGFKDAEAVADIRARSHAQAADLRGAGVGEVVAVQVGRGEDLIFVGARQDLLEDGIGDAVVDQDFLLPLAVAVGGIDGIESSASLRRNLLSEMLRWLVRGRARSSRRFARR